MQPTDEMLMAYADGALDPAEAAEVERAVALDEALAARLARLADVRGAVKRAYGPPPAVPAALDARVRALIAADLSRRSEATSANVVSLASRRTVPFWQLPFAAMLALAVGAGSTWIAVRGEGSVAGLRLGGLTDPAVTEVLGSLPSGGTATLADGARLAVVASFRDGEGRLCREFEEARSDDTVVAVACRDDAGWELQFALAAPTADEDYAPASALEVLDAYFAASDAGPPLALEAEAAALRAED